MLRVKAGVAIGATLLCGAAALGSAAVAGAWPTTVTGEMQRFSDTARNGGAPGDDDALLTQGYLACHILYTHQGRQAALDATSVVIVDAATGTLCTQAPG